MVEPNLYKYRGKITRVIDGDTCEISIDLGLDICLQNQRLRLYGINTPELHGVDKDKAIAAKDYLSALVLNQDVFITTFKSKGKDKYGRYLVKIFLPDKNKSVNEMLLDKGYAVAMVY